MNNPEEEVKKKSDEIYREKEGRYWNQRGVAGVLGIWYERNPRSETARRNYLDAVNDLHDINEGRKKQKEL
jgi:hypothetical protein